MIEIVTNAQVRTYPCPINMMDDAVERVMLSYHIEEEFQDIVFDRYYMQEKNMSLVN